MTARSRAAGTDVISEAYRGDHNFVGSTRDANAAGVDLVVAIHHDIRIAQPGSFAYHWPSSTKGKALATSIIDTIKAAGRPTRPARLGPGKGFASGPVAGRGLYILEHTRAPATLVEIGPIGHETLDTPEELRAYGDLVADGVLEWAGMTPPAKAPLVHRDVALSASRHPDREWIRMAAHRHAFAYVEQDAAGGWTQIYPDDRTTPVDSIDYLVALGWEAGELVKEVDDGVAITPDSGNLTRLRAIDLIADTDVPRRRPWS